MNTPIDKMVVLLHNFLVEPCDASSLKSLMSYPSLFIGG